MNIGTINYRQRRNQLAKLLNGGVAVIHAFDHQVRSHDTEFPYRVNSDFKYLCGAEEPQGWLVIEDRGGVAHSTLFVRPKDAKMELWTGRRLGVEKAAQVFEMDACYAIDQFSEILPDLIADHETLFADFYDQSIQQSVLPIMQGLGNRRKNKTKTPHKINHIRGPLGHMRLIKCPAEIAAIDTAAIATSFGHQGAMAMAKDGLNERDILSFMEYLFARKGCTHTAYGSIVAGGDNALILHYVENDAPLKDGELILIDAGAEFDCYASDVTRTFPVGGSFTSAQKDIYQLVLNAQKDAMALAVPGNSLAQLHKKAQETLLKGLLDLNILKGTMDEHQEKNTLQNYYPHGTGHWLGLDVHDMCPYYNDQSEDILFKEGMIFTIEPGLYFQTYQSEIPKEYAHIGIRIEDDILITKDSHRNLTAMIPKEIKEVEEACQKDISSFYI